MNEYEIFYWSIVIFLMCCAVPFIGPSNFITLCIDLLYISVRITLCLFCVLNHCVAYFVEILQKTFGNEKGEGWSKEFYDGAKEVTECIYCNSISLLGDQKMVKPIKKENFDYVCSSDIGEDDKPIENATVFFLRTLTVKEEYLARDGLVEGSGPINNRKESFKMGSFEHGVIRRGIVGWEKFGIGENEIKFKSNSNGFVDDDLLTMIPRDERAELAAAIQSGSDYNHKKALKEAEERAEAVA